MIIDIFEQTLSRQKIQRSDLTTKASFIKKGSAYGVTVSYLPTFAQIETLLKGDPNKLWEKTANGDESHVYRYMNVWGSGGAHSTYFKKIDEIIIEILTDHK